MCVCRRVEERERKRWEFEIGQLVCTAVLFHIKVKFKVTSLWYQLPHNSTDFHSKSVLLILKNKPAGSLPQTDFLKKEKLAVPVTLFPNSTLYKPQFSLLFFLLLASHKLEMSCCSTLFRLAHTLYMLQHFNLSGFSPQTTDVRMCSLPLLGMPSRLTPEHLTQFSFHLKAVGSSWKV